MEDVKQMLETLVPLTREVAAHLDDEEQWYLVRLLPYRTEADQIEGAVVTFVEITEMKETEAALRAREQELAALTETLEARVQQRTEEVRELATRLTMAEHEERARVAQILHDDLQQRLYAMQIQLGFVRANYQEGEAVGAEITQMEDALQKAITVTRRLSVDLSPPILAGEGLKEAIEWLAHQMAEQYGLTVTVTSEPEGDSFLVPALDRRVLIFQMVRELLFNVVKHAGVARATVRLRQVSLPDGARAYRVDVVDEGPGFDLDTTLASDVSAEGRGLRQMAERLDLIGGRLEVSATPATGTRVTIFAPPGEEE